MNAVLDPGALADFPAYDHPAAERHWYEMLALFAGTLI